MTISMWLRRIAKELPAWTHPMLRAFWHVGAELLVSVIAVRRPRFGHRVEFTSLEIVEMRRFFVRGPGRGKVVVKTLVSAMSPGTELAVLLGLPNAVRGMPFTPGYSGFGVVVSAGRGTRLKRGDYVAGQIGHASVAVVNENDLIACDSANDGSILAMIELGCIVQQGVRKANIHIGDHVLVVGAGLLGQLSVIYADLMGAGKITLFSRSERKKQSAAEVLPLHEFKAGAESDKSLGADVAIECVGTSSALSTAAANVRPGGRVVNLGSPRDAGSASELFSAVSANSVELVGAHISTLPGRDGNPHNMTKHEERATFVELVRRGQFRMPSHVVVPATSSENVNNAYESIRSTGSSATVLFEW